ncbi:serine hydrolase [Streptomyces sp. MN3]|uniref:serine hydrolase n=1 Tax=Streptomyces sp. yara TaxID=3458421 RepID=UPI0040401A7E
MTDGARVSAAALDLAGGQTYASGEGVFVTASVVKVDILTALLLTARDAGRELTATERAHAEAMIVRSDNDAATALWQVVGRAAGLDAANARLGLTRTVADARWGLTRTTAADRVTLLRRIFAPDAVVEEASRAYVRELTERVVPEQAWGVPALADPGTRWAVKNGWLPRDATGLWVVNSTGCVTVSGRAYAVAVLSDGHASMADGVARVEEAARDAVRRCGGAAAPTRADPAARMPAAGAVAAVPLKGAGNCAASHALPAPADAAPPPPHGGAD